MKIKIQKMLWSCVIAVSLMFTYNIAAGDNKKDITLIWTSVPNIVTYKCYYGSASMTFTNVITVGNTTSLTISNLTVGQTYYFAITSVYKNQIESDFSKELRVYVK